MRVSGTRPHVPLPGLDERAILDKLRTEGMLPNQVDYQTWRTKHLKSYTRKAPMRTSPGICPMGAPSR